MNWSRLAEVAKARRAELERDQAEVVRRAGKNLSLAVLSQLENGRNPAPREATLAALDRGLDWHIGSSRRVAEGGKPRPLEDAAGANGKEPAIPQPAAVAIMNEIAGAATDVTAALKQVETELRALGRRVDRLSRSLSVEARPGKR